MIMRDIEALLNRSIGLDPATLGVSSVRRAVERRRRALGLMTERPEAYLRLVRESEAELQELIEEIVVPETWFFRDGRPFVELRRHAAEWLARPDTGRHRFRVLSVPCSSGEEPYSIAMTLLDTGMSRERFTIDALDISARNLERARRGIYGPRSLRAIDPTLRDRHFRPNAEGSELAPEVRECVQFLQGNLLAARTLQGRAPYHVIFCRNLLIYFDTEARERAVATLDRLLVPDGLLFVGHAERIPLLESRFLALPAAGCFGYRKVTPEQRAAARPGSTRPVQETQSIDGPRPGSGTTPVSRRAAPVPAPTTPEPASRRGTAPVSPPEPSPSPPPSPPAELLAEAAELANRHQYDRAAALCEQAVARAGPSADAFHLLGAIRQAAGDLDAAERWLTKAVYLDANHADALLALALIARRRGDAAAEARYRRRAERARQRNDPS